MAEVVVDEQQGTAQHKRNVWEQLVEGFYRGAEDRSYEIGATPVEHIIHDAAWNPKNWQQAYRGTGDRPPTFAERIGATMGLAVKDLMRDGSRIPYWALNHPLAIYGVASDAAAEAAGLRPDYAALEKHAKKNKTSIDRDVLQAQWEEHMGFDKKRIPLVIAGRAAPFIGAAALVQASGNHDLLNPLEGGRSPGFEAVIPQEGDPTKSANVPGEVVARYLFGRTGRLLPWEQFTEERPDVSPQDYGSYRAHQYDKGLFNIGLFKGTSRNIEGEPEFTMMGFRTPLSAVGAGAGALTGSVLGASAAVAAAAKTARELSGDGPFPAGRHMGPRRLAGSIAGAIAGAIAGKYGTQAVNDLALQPLINPEAVEAERVWREQQRAAGAL